MRVPAQQIRRQLVSVFRAWGMSEAHADTTADMMVETDLRGVDSHGIGMLPTYDQEFRNGRLNMRPTFKTVRQTAATALIDADASLGHPAAAYGMNLAVDKCLAVGVGVVDVFNSHHFGAAGCYSRIAADRGVIGMVTSATRGVTMVPTFGAEPVMGTNPLAFAAPAKRNPPFELDMATTTVAAGKVRVYKLNHTPLPAGWVVDGDGKTVTDSAKGFQHVTSRDGGITPLGGTREAGSHKGYGLAVMVDVLSAVLSGANWGPFTPPFALRQEMPARSVGKGTGHFFGALRIDAFIDKDEFKRQIDDFIRTLRKTRPAPGTAGPLIPGDPEREAEAIRRREGIPLVGPVVEELRDISRQTGIPLI